MDSRAIYILLFATIIASILIIFTLCSTNIAYGCYSYFYERSHSGVPIVNSNRNESNSNESNSNESNSNESNSIEMSSDLV